MSCSRRDGHRRGGSRAHQIGVAVTLAKDRPTIRLAHCWAHIRRDYVTLEKAFPRETSEMLFWMKWVWAVESHAKHADGSVDLERLAVLRATFSRAAVEEIAKLAKAIAAAHDPASGIAVASRTMLDVWPALTVFLDDARVPVDNNARERALRGMVIGRKNHYGSRSERGSHVAAILYVTASRTPSSGRDSSPPRSRS